MNLSRMSIKTRLTLGFGALAACVVVVSALSLRALSESTQGFSGFVQGITARATLANNVRTAVDRRAIAARNLVLVIKPQDLEMEKAEVLRAHEEVQAQLAQLKAMADDGRNVSEQARALAEAIDRVEARYGPVATGIVQLALDGKRDEAIQKMDDECRPLLAELIQATTAYARYTRERQEQLVAADEAQYGQRAAC